MGFMPVLQPFTVKLVILIASIVCIPLHNALNASHPSSFMTRNVLMHVRLDTSHHLGQMYVKVASTLVRPVNRHLQSAHPVSKDTFTTADASTIAHQVFTRITSTFYAHHATQNALSVMEVQRIAYRVRVDFTIFSMDVTLVVLWDITLKRTQLFVLIVSTYAWVARMKVFV